MVQADYKGHKDHVTCCDLSPSGKLVVSSSEDCTVKVSVWVGGWPLLVSVLCVCVCVCVCV